MVLDINTVMLTWPSFWLSWMGMLASMSQYSPKHLLFYWVSHASLMRDLFAHSYQQHLPVESRSGGKSWQGIQRQSWQGKPSLQRRSKNDPLIVEILETSVPSNSIMSVYRCDYILSLVEGLGVWSLWLFWTTVTSTCFHWLPCNSKCHRIWSILTTHIKESIQSFWTS